MLLIVGFVQMSFAQIHLKDSTEAYNYWAKRGVIEAVYAYMQDYKTVKGSLNSKEELGKNDFENNFISNIEDDNISEINTKLNSISTFLTNSKYDWKGCEKTIFQPLQKQLDISSDLKSLFDTKRKDKNENDIPIDFIGDVKGNNINRSEHWSSTRNRIVNEYEKTLSEFKKVNPNNSSVENPEPINYENPVSQSEERIQNVSPNRQKKIIPWKVFLIYGSLVFIGFIVGGLLLFLITKNKIKSIVEGKYYDYLNAHENDSRFLFGYLSVVSFLQKRKIFYENKTKSNKDIGFDTANLERKVSQLEREKQVLLDENIELGKKIELLQPKKQSFEPEKNSVKTTSSNSQPQRQLTKAYFSMPGGDGSFQISNGEPSNDGKKYFRIEFEESSNRGELFYMPSERDQKAINRLESFLKPVCDIENISNASTATKIELIQSGKVSLINDSWVIDTNNKIKIKLY